ncbi:hypothetical protein GUJ93_ZPchr0001g30743 [Zizania palustris]|uniref:DNA (cytosine-5)-methyltransferase 1 replication foci domain-containing protein n=1 Tax=Zizania palustris TaxID=103762 RepID=A0A8J5RE41_ZIZPA|nr:hypothetical protein GUJ93_ZPchr0001g30743 [Zizania palustris]
MLMFDDDDDEPQVDVVDNYFLLDTQDQPVCISVLPFQFKATDGVPECKKDVFLRGTADPGIKVFRKVVAWRLGLQGKQPEISLLSTERSWISLAKPKNSYQEVIRSILITVQMLHFLKRKPEETEKNLWIHLRRIFDKFDVRPSEDDFRNHHLLIKQFAEKDLTLAKSQKNIAKKINKVGSDKVEIKVPFIADDDIDEIIDMDTNIESDEEEDLFDSICAICDNGGDLLCCDGPCMRSFHAKIGTADDSYCDTLGYTEAQVQVMKNFLCKNCEHKQHQCLSVEYWNLLMDQLLWCFFVIMLPVGTFTTPNVRCPKSYHRKCLPREIAFEDSENEDSITRAWELSKRILIYCLDHEIDTDIETPTRDHIKFPRIPNIDRPARILKNSVNVVAKKKRGSFSEEVPDQFAGLSDMALIQESHQARKTCARSSSEHFVDKPEKKKAKLLEVREQPEPYMVNDTIASSTKPVKDQEELLATMPSSNTRKIPQSSFPTVDNETESRVIALVEREAPYLTLKDVSRKLKMPSTYLYPGRKIDTIIATGKLEHSVQAVGAALKVLENGGNVNAAKAVCEPDVLKQLTKWHSKLSVYISPFIYGSRYSSFGRHFTKVEKLVEIVDKLHWYVEPGDTIVDFCCGANDFSRLMKEKLDQVQKKCHFKNYDLIQPQNSFSFERRDWMTVQRKELPEGSKLIMGLNPPFGVKAALANKFIDRALIFKPKLIILIVPKETKRLDQKKTPYDLVWEDSECLSGKAFYLPGSVDVNDKIVEGWNASAPPLYLWSRPDWTKMHMEVAVEHNHTSIGSSFRVQEDNPPDYLPLKKETESYGKHNSRSGGKQETGNNSCNLKEANLFDLPVREQAAQAANKRNARPGKEKEATERTACNPRDVILSGDHPVKKQAGAKGYHPPDRLPLKKQAEINFEHVSQLGKEKDSSLDESSSSHDRSRKITPDKVDNILSREKQVEVAYEEQMAIPTKKNTHQEKQGDAYRRDRINAHRGSKIMGVGLTEKVDSDMSMSSPETSNAQNKSRNCSPFISSEDPCDKAAHSDSYIRYPPKKDYLSVSKQATYEGNYLASKSGSNDAFEGKIDPTSHTNIDDITRKYSTSIDGTKQHFTAPKEWNTNVVERSMGDSDNYLQTSRLPQTLDVQAHLRSRVGHADDLYTSHYPIGSSSVRYGQPSLTPPSHGLLATIAPGSSVMDKYAPSLEDTNYNRRVPQYPYRRPGSSGGEQRREFRIGAVRLKYEEELVLVVLPMEVVARRWRWQLTQWWHWGMTVWESLGDGSCGWWWRLTLMRWLGGLCRRLFVMGRAAGSDSFAPVITVAAGGCREVEMEKMLSKACTRAGAR